MDLLRAARLMRPAGCVTSSTTSGLPDVKSLSSVLSNTDVIERFASGSDQRLSRHHCGSLHNAGYACSPNPERSPAGRRARSRHGAVHSTPFTDTMLGGPSSHVLGFLTPLKWAMGVVDFDRGPTIGCGPAIRHLRPRPTACRDTTQLADGAALNYAGPAESRQAYGRLIPTVEAVTLARETCGYRTDKSPSHPQRLQPRTLVSARDLSPRPWLPSSRFYPVSPEAPT